VSLTTDEVAWLERAGADLGGVFDAPATTMTERKQLLRTVLSEVRITVDSETKQAALRICFEGGACLERTVPAPRPGGHQIQATDEDTVALVRRLGRHYSDTRIAQILSREGRNTATGLPFTRERVNALRQTRGIPSHQPSQLNQQDATIMTLGEAQRSLGVSGVTLYRWLRQGFIAGTQLIPGGRWHVRVDDELRAKIVPDVPAGWLGLKQAARAWCRQTDRP